jgi:hypothetical protein
MNENKKVNIEETTNDKNEDDKKSQDKVPEEFSKIMKDFYKDILLVFPEIKYQLDNNIIEFLQDKQDSREIFDYCLKIYPERFFDILYQNDEIFQNDDINTYFLPDIEFKKLWKEEISDNTRKTIWKYLQLILFSVSSSIKNGKEFGNTEKLFEAIDQDEMKKKLEETMKEMGEMFNNTMDEEGAENFMNADDLPNPEDLQNHINGLMDGKLGRLAQEIANETAEDMDIDMEESANVGDVFQKLLKNPSKLMELVKNIGSKLDSKLKSGEIKESELMQEAADLMEKMKSMPGMKNMNKIFSKMGVPMGKNQKVSTSAMQANLAKNMRAATQKERMLRKLEQRRAQKQQEAQVNMKINTNYKHMKFKTDDSEVEKSIRPKKKKKKKKKKKNK